MVFDLDSRTAALSVGEFAEFSIGPRDGSGGLHGLWRAEIGTHWHRQLHTQIRISHPHARVEVPVEGRVAHRGWIISLNGRIDQILPESGSSPQIFREIKTITTPLPAADFELRAQYADHFAQLATYLALARIENPDTVVSGELLFVEIGAGTLQTVPVTRGEDPLFLARLESLTEFLDHRRHARERLRTLRFRSAFQELRPGQESTRADLDVAVAKSRIIAFEAPTGFGKTGMMLECALGQLRSGRFSRVICLTGKSTGQLQLIRTLGDMTGAPDPSGTAPPTSSGRPLALWHVRAKSEHCVNTTFHCVREGCGYLAGAASRWPQSGLARFLLTDDHPRDIDALRDAGRDAFICPYEITRTALAFNDVWVGDYNYVFSPRNRGLFFEQPGFDPAQTLLIVDEAHNLPSRVADAHSHTVRAEQVQATLADLEHCHAGRSFLRAWAAWTELLMSLPACDAIDLALEDEITDALRRLTDQVGGGSIDFHALGPASSERVWEIVELHAWLTDTAFPRLLWCPSPGELRFTCLDAASVIGSTLQSFSCTLLASATLGPIDAFGTALGLASPPRQAELPHSPPLAHVVAHTPWRSGAYRIAYDLRVDTTYRRRDAHAHTTAATVERLRAAANSSIVVFFPSYHYAESIAGILESANGTLRIALQPRGQDLAAKAAWVDESLLLADALFLVLGSSFAESIDLLGGRITHAMVVGPALPEVNAVQRARMEIARTGTGDAAFRKIYQIPGMQKVNQALGRLVRAPGQKAQVLLHCRRFGEADYASLLSTDYQFGANILTDGDLDTWLSGIRM